MIIFRASRHISQAEIIERAQTEQPIVRKTTLTKAQQSRAIQADEGHVGPTPREPYHRII